MIRPNVAALAADITTKRAAIAAVRAEADGLIEQAERRAKGLDRGRYRDDDTLRLWTIRDSAQLSADFAFHLSAKFADAPVPNGWMEEEASMSRERNSVRCTCTPSRGLACRKCYAPHYDAGLHLVGHTRNIFRTNAFVSAEAAARYYDATQAEVLAMVAEERISIGRPEVKPGERLSVIPGEGRYQIES